MNCPECDCEMILCPADFSWDREYWVCPDCECVFSVDGEYE